MIRIILTLFILNNILSAAWLSDEERYINGKYNDNLKIIWLYKKADNSSDGLQNNFAKALNKSTKILSETFDNVKTEKKSDYGDMISLLEDNEKNTNKQILTDEFAIELLDKTVDNQLVAAFKIEKIMQNNNSVYRLFGLKLFKDGDKSIVTTYEVNKKTDKITVKTLQDMIEFFVMSSIENYEGIQRNGVSPIITYSNSDETSLQITSFKVQDVKKFISYVSQQDIELAYKTKLISSDKITPIIAQEYCESLGMMLINKNFILEDIDDEYYYEQLYKKYSFKNSSEVYKKIVTSSEPSKKFRCIDAKNGKDIKTMQDYEATEIGIKYRLNSDTVFHKEKITAIDIETEEAFDGSAKIYIAMIDKTGFLTIWENNEQISSKQTDILNAYSLDLSKSIDYIKIKSLQRKIIYKNENGTLNITSDTFTEDDEKIKETKYINDDGLFVISEFKSNGKTISINMNQELQINKITEKLNFWPTSLAIGKNEISIGSKDKISTYKLEDNDKVKMQTIQERIGVTGDIVKLVYFNDGEYLVAGTTNSELVFYKKGKLEPIKTIKNYGYSINDISISNSEKFLIVSNGDQTIYVFDLEVILNSILINKDGN